MMPDSAGRFWDTTTLYRSRLELWKTAGMRLRKAVSRLELPLTMI